MSNAESVRRPDFELVFEPERPETHFDGYARSMVEPVRRVKIEILQRGEPVLRLEAVSLTPDQPIFTFNPKVLDELVSAANAWAEHQRQIDGPESSGRAATEMPLDLTISDPVTPGRGTLNDGQEGE